MNKLFSPDTIAVVGASSDRNKPGGKVIGYLRQHGYAGAVVPISRSAGEIAGLRTYPSIDAYDGDLDVAVLAIPGAAVPGTLRGLAARRCAAAVVFASGFAELGEAGRGLQHEIAAQARAAGIRLLGPNTQGYANLRDRVVCHFGATLAEPITEVMPVAVVSQSGAASQIVYLRLRELGITPSFVTATGNEADISVAQTVRWYLEAGDVRTVIAYAETLNDVGELAEAACLARDAGKSIILVKAGRTGAGAHAASSHTGALMVEDAAVSAFLDQAGIMRAGNLKQAAELAQLALLELKPRLTARTMSISNSGASCVMSADAIESAGLSLAPLRTETLAALRSALPDYVSAGNPVDMTTATLQRPRLFEEILAAVARHDAVDLVHVAFPIGSPDYDFDLYARNLREFQSSTRTCVAVSLNQDWARDIFRSHGLPVFDTEEEAVRALALARAWRDEHHPPPVAASPPVAADAALLHTCNELDSLAMLRAAGLPVVDAFGADDVDTLLAHAREANAYPYVLKGVSDSLTHKSELGLVRLGLATAHDITAAAADIAAALRSAGESRARYLLAPLVTADLEIMMGATRHPAFGAVLVVAAGGVDVEAQADTATVILPASPSAIRQALLRLRIAWRFAGHRGRPAVDVDALCDVIHRFAQWFGQHPEVHGVDVNPLLVDSRTGRLAIVDSVVTRVNT